MISHLTNSSNLHWSGGVVGASCKTKKFKEMCKAYLEFPWGWEGGGVPLLWGRYGYLLELNTSKCLEMLHSLKSADHS